MKNSALCGGAFFGLDERGRKKPDDGACVWRFAVLRTSRDETRPTVELAMIAGLLHDLYTCATLESKEHAAKGALMARELLSGFAAVYTGRNRHDYNCD